MFVLILLQKKEKFFDWLGYAFSIISLNSWSELAFFNNLIILFKLLQIFMLFFIPFKISSIPLSFTSNVDSGSIVPIPTL